MIGQQIGQYRVLGKIGEGGMGAVYEAEDAGIGKRVAIKVLHKDHAKNPQIAARFINEARAITAVDHPGLVQVLMSDRLPDGTAYIVMELLKGETLNARLKSQGGRLPMQSAIQLGRQIASALAAAHAKDIIHRDLKPDNVMIVADSAFPTGERAKLLDFGIAKLKLEYQGQGDQVMTRAGVMMGTPLYMAPEQCRNASDVDEKADVYSLGIMLYRMLAGRPPFSAPGTGELMAMHIYMQPPPLGEADRSLPDPLVKLVHRMLAKNRTERPSMAEVAKELERIGATATGVMPAVPAPTSQPMVSVNESATVVSENAQPIPPPPRRRRWLLILALGLIVGLLATGGVVLYQMRKQQPTKPPITTNTADNKAVPPGAAKTDKPDPPAPKAVPVKWHIESEPSGAEIYRVDGNKLEGHTPFRSEQPKVAGQIEFELRMAGYAPAKLTLDGSKDEEPPVVKLEPEKPAKKADEKPPKKKPKSKSAK
jgi:serine/threonine-protein kinase